MSSWADSLPGQLLSLLWVWLSSMAGQLSMERLGDCILELHRPCSRQTCPHTVQTPPPPLSTAPSLPQRQQTVDVQEHRSFNICKQSITLSPLSLSLALSLSLSLCCECIECTNSASCLYQYQHFGSRRPFPPFSLRRDDRFSIAATGWFTLAGRVTQTLLVAEGQRQEGTFQKP